MPAWSSCNIIPRPELLSPSTFVRRAGDWWFKGLMQSLFKVTIKRILALCFDSGIKLRILNSWHSWTTKISVKYLCNSLGCTLYPLDDIPVVGIWIYVLNASPYKHIWMGVRIGLPYRITDMVCWIQTRKVWLWPSALLLYGLRNVVSTSVCQVYQECHYPSPTRWNNGRMAAAQWFCEGLLSSPPLQKPRLWLPPLALQYWRWLGFDS